MIEPFEVRSGGLKVSAILTVPDAGRGGPYPAVILSHGLVSSKESTKHIALSEALAAAGIASCRFDYHGCGESAGRIEETTLTTRIDNLVQVTEWVRRHRSVDAERIGLLGSSFGGATSLAVAAGDERIRCISLWSTPYLLDSKEDASISDIAFRQDIFVDFERYDLLAEARKVSCGLVVHGELDEVVPFSEGKAIYENLKEPKRFELIPEADHVFSLPAHRDRAIGLAVDWFKGFLL
jgi:uncharacterized protein